MENGNEWFPNSMPVQHQVQKMGVDVLSCPPSVLQDIANLVQMSQTGQEGLRLTAARVSNAVAYNASIMATVTGEEGAVKFFARLDVELMKVSSAAHFLMNLSFAWCSHSDPDGDVRVKSPRCMNG